MRKEKKDAKKGGQRLHHPDHQLRNYEAIHDIWWPKNIVGKKYSTI